MINIFTMNNDRIYGPAEVQMMTLDDSNQIQEALTQLASCKQDLRRRELSSYVMGKRCADKVNQKLKKMSHLLIRQRKEKDALKRQMELRYQQIQQQRNYIQFFDHEKVIIEVVRLIVAGHLKEADQLTKEVQRGSFRQSLCSMIQKLREHQTIFDPQMAAKNNERVQISQQRQKYAVLLEENRRFVENFSAELDNIIISFIEKKEDNDYRESVLSPLKEYISHSTNIDLLLAIARVDELALSYKTLQQMISNKVPAQYQTSLAQSLSYILQAKHQEQRGLLEVLEIQKKQIEEYPSRQMTLKNDMNRQKSHYQAQIALIKQEILSKESVYQTQISYLVEEKAQYESEMIESIKKTKQGIETAQFISNSLTYENEQLRRYNQSLNQENSKLTRIIASRTDNLMKVTKNLQEQRTAYQRLEQKMIIKEFEKDRLLQQLKKHKQEKYEMKNNIQRQLQRSYKTINSLQRFHSEEIRDLDHQKGQLMRENNRLNQIISSKERPRMGQIKRNKTNSVIPAISEAPELELDLRRVVSDVEDSKKPLLLNQEHQSSIFDANQSPRSARIIGSMKRQNLVGSQVFISKITAETGSSQTAVEKPPPSSLRKEGISEIRVPQQAQESLITESSIFQKIEILPANRVPSLNKSLEPEEVDEEPILAEVDLEKTHIQPQ